MNEVVQIPEVVLLKDVYIELNIKQRESFANRLNFYLEIANNIQHAKMEYNWSFDSVIDVIDDIELDISSINMSYSELETGLSIYRIHDSWTFDSDVSVLHEQLDNKVKKIIENVIKNVSDIPFCSVDEMCDWLDQWALLVKRELTAFSEAKSYDVAIAHLLIVHALMGLVTCATALSKLNPAIDGDKLLGFGRRE